MEKENKPTYLFQTAALPPDTFHLIKFQGTEGLSQCYDFHLHLATENQDLDLDRVMEKPAVLKIIRQNGEIIHFNGILAQMNELGASKGLVFYEARLAPKLWWLNFTRHNQIFLDMLIPQIIEAVLKDGGLTHMDFELRLTQNYTPHKYVCQYRESHYNFFARWLEHLGIYYFFEQGPDREKIIITDVKLAHVELESGQKLIYSPPSGLDSLHMEEVVNRFALRQQLTPQKLLLKDYNDQKPSLDLTSEAEVNPRGYGELYYYGDYYETREDGKILANIRAEEMKCREKQFTGQGSAPFLRPGYLFQLQDHYRPAFNQTYLIVSLEHEGNQTAYLVDGLGLSLTTREKGPVYRNKFTAISAGVQFRPPRKAKKPRFYGVMTAHVDAAGSGQYAELDEQGRYKVILPFDLSGRKDGKASTWLRMAQPYAGTDHGMHFPLHKGTEVLLTFIDGDPDRPIITGAVPNAEYPSMVTSANQTRAGFKTAGGGQFYAEDLKGKQQFVMKPGDDATVLRAGAGSGSSIDGWSTGVNLGGSAGASFFSGLAADTVAVKSATSLTGSWCALLVPFFKNTILEKGPGLVAKLIKGDKSEKSENDKTPEEKEKEKEAQEEEMEQLETWIEGIAELAVEAAIYTAMVLIEKSMLTNAGNNLPEVPDHPAFLAISQGDKTLVMNEGHGHDIFLATDHGTANMYGQKSVSLGSNGDATITAANTTIASERGLVKVFGNDIRLNGMANGLATAAIRIAPNGNISIQQENQNGITEINSNNTVRIKVGGREIQLNNDGCTTTVGQNQIKVTESGIQLTRPEQKITLGNNVIRLMPSPGNFLGLQKGIMAINFPTVDVKGDIVNMRAQKKVIFS